ncbi:glyoxylate/hydroxypyruvate reductase HPR3-like [Andrographis paniculata]|uniref:glyoxylate/hydroxypyruvate reductase HPR3-like n=1 Tax=Andrographis paniculata TaxID=175694 RepID=UPI0021E892C2|nr:glyoxylate/hydroxypyruvate reductase HPR3-like [Andrographis paniculata]
MAEDLPHHLPELLVLGPPLCFQICDKDFSSRFRILRSWESPLPLHQFLRAEAQATQVALCSGLFSFSADVLRDLPSLRLLLTSSAGVNNVDLVECSRRGVEVANAAGIYSADVADFAVGLLLDVLRKISAGNRFVKNGLWSKQGAYPLGSKLGGKRVGIVGLGSIGNEIAKRLKPFGCSISYSSRNKKLSVPYVFYSDVCKLAAASDILIICCALTEETHHLINREVMLSLGKGGIIINIARGAVVDEKELVNCLKRGDISGAGLDVFENEPLVPEELCELDNVVLTPHCAVFTKESPREVFELVCKNIEAFYSHRPLLSSVFAD